MSERYGVDYSKALSGIKQRKLHQFEVSSINTKTELKVMPKTKLAPLRVVRQPIPISLNVALIKKI